MLEWDDGVKKRLSKRNIISNFRDMSAKNRRMFLSNTIDGEGPIENILLDTD